MDRTMTAPTSLDSDNPYAFAAGGAFATWDDDYRPAGRLRWLLAAGIITIIAAAAFYLKGGF